VADLGFRAGCVTITERTFRVVKEASLTRVTLLATERKVTVALSSEFVTR